MNSLQLKYGCNPNQKPSRIFMQNGGNLPVQVLNGNPGYINFLDAFNSWQLVKEASNALSLPCAASFKHVSPAGAALGLPLSEIERKIYFAPKDLSPIASAYARARGADRMSSFGDWVALSETCDADTANLLKSQVSDGIIAPGFTDEALEILKKKRNGSYNVVKVDSNFIPDELEHKTVFGVTFEQGRNNVIIDQSWTENVVSENKSFPNEAVRDLILALITLKYTQSNSVCYTKNGQVVGVGAGQQSRIHCTRLAGDKSDLWHLRQHEKTLALQFNENVKIAERDNIIDVYLSDDYDDVIGENVWGNFFSAKPEAFSREEKQKYLRTISGVCLASDAFFPFGDNIERAKKSGVSFIVEPGGSIRDNDVIETCNKYGMTMAFCGMRLFHH